MAKNPSLTTPIEEEATLGQGVWPVGSADLRGGKKGDIFRLVMNHCSDLLDGKILMLCACMYVCVYVGSNFIESGCWQT